jgi:serine/threonine protein kinase
MAVNDLIGKKFGPYEITGVLGSGGMGDVLRAQHCESGLEVALKILPREYVATDEGKHLARFKREIEQSSRLNHKNLCKVYDYGTADGLHYYCMEVIEGIELGDYIKERTFIDLDEVYHIIRQLSEGLAYLHDKNVIHRDLKPSNVFLKPDKTVVLADFGLLKDMSEEDITGENTRLGTPTYMSPEQFQGTKIDTRTDIYQLGVVFYKLLTGETPFDGDSFFALGIKVMTKKIPSPCRHNPEIPEEIERIVMKTCEKKPENRYQTAKELGADIERYFKQRDEAKNAEIITPAGEDKKAVSAPKSPPLGVAGRKQRASLTKQQPAVQASLNKSGINGSPALSGIHSPLSSSSADPSLNDSSIGLGARSGHGGMVPSDSIQRSGVSKTMAPVLRRSSAMMKVVGPQKSRESVFSELVGILSKRMVVDLFFLTGFVGVIALSLTGKGTTAIFGGFLVEDSLGFMAIIALLSGIHYVTTSPIIGDTKKTALFFLGLYCFPWILGWVNFDFSFRKLILNENQITHGGLFEALLSPFRATFTVMSYIFMPITILIVIFHVISLLTTKNEKEAIPLFVRFLIMFSALFFLLHFRNSVGS